MTRDEQIEHFDPNGPGLPGKLFGLPFDTDSAQLIIIPVPWEATVTYRAGTAQAPESILAASQQIDLYHPHIQDGWKLGMTMLPVPEMIRDESNRMRVLMTTPQTEEADRNLIINKINEGSENLNVYVKNTAMHWLSKGKIVGLVGGDHSTPLGLIRALGEKYDRFGILQIDAHADLRKAYEGFTYSHGSIMFNALKNPSVSKLVQVGIRDYCEEELSTMKRGMGRVKTWFDEDLQERKDKGDAWRSICQEIVRDLPDLVYLTLDVDGLDRSLCPNTGTPVPGGLKFGEAVTLIRTIAESGRKIIAFDMNEVGFDENQTWDAIVGARLLWQLCHWTAVSQGKLISTRH